MRIGVDYYPEHWDKSLWEQDADLMAKTGVRLVRMAEFAWSRMEPKDGVFDFGWLDEVIRLFADRGISVVLGTPTACPPLWFYEKYPDAVMVDRDGQRIRTGIRGHRCINHPEFRRYARRIVEHMARHYAGNKAVAAWQIDNELEAYHCFCDRCADSFRGWLKEKYSTVEALNRAYGNVVWSGEYSSWNQVQPPFGHYPDAWMNPALMLDYNRFASENVIRFSSWQASLIRRQCPGVPVTTNTWFCEHMPDFYQEFKDLDFVAYDNYPPTRLPEDPEACVSHAFHLDLMRGVKRAPFWIMEQLSGGPGCWMPMCRMPSPGMIRGYALQAFAHGADTVLFFRWRTASIGAEMHWHGLLDHSNVPGRRFTEFANLCTTAKSLAFLQGSEIKASVAILFSFDNEYAFKIQPQTEGYYYFEQLQRVHRACMELGLNVDVVSEKEDFSGYRVVIAPEMYVTDPAVSGRLHTFARQGGTVILTARSGVKDIHNNAVMSPLPGVYRDMAGASVAEYNPIGRDQIPLIGADGQAYRGTQWCDILEPEGAETLVRYDGDYYRGSAAVTRNRFDRGLVYYIGTVGDEALYRRILMDAAGDAGLEVYPDLPPLVEVTTRTTADKVCCFVFNHSPEPRSVTIRGETLSLEPFEMKIITRNP